MGPDDLLKIQVEVSGEIETALSREYKVDTDGTINVSLLGRVLVEGKTVNEIEQELKKALENGFIQRAQVSVQVTEYRSRTIFILGEVRNPAPYQINGEVTLIEAIARAQSFTANAGDEVILSRKKSLKAGSTDEVELLRVNREDLTLARPGSGYDILLQDGDTISVPPAKKFYISGQVKNPGYHNIYKDMTVGQAIAVAGGLTDRGSDKRLNVRRRDAKGVVRELKIKREDLVLADDQIVVGSRIF